MPKGIDIKSSDFSIDLDHLVYLSPHFTVSKISFLYRTKTENAAMAQPNITLYTGQSPNGIKISITLEELGLPYTVRTINMHADEQKSEWFAEINPNGRIPALTDTFDDGQQIRVFESGSIMQYLVNRYDKDFKISYPPGTREHIEVLLNRPS